MSGTPSAETISEKLFSSFSLDFSVVASSFSDLSSVKGFSGFELLAGKNGSVTSFGPWFLFVVVVIVVVVVVFLVVAVVVVVVDVPFVVSAFLLVVEVDVNLGL